MIYPDWIGVVTGGVAGNPAVTVRVSLARQPRKLAGVGYVNGSVPVLVLPGYEATRNTVRVLANYFGSTSTVPPKVESTSSVYPAKVTVHYA